MACWLKHNVSCPSRGGEICGGDLQGTVGVHIHGVIEPVQDSTSCRAAGQWLLDYLDRYWITLIMAETEPSGSMSGQVTATDTKASPTLLVILCPTLARCSGHVALGHGLACLISCLTCRQTCCGRLPAPPPSAFVVPGGQCCSLQ